jgi:WXG100 family type VII secretion target
MAQIRIDTEHTREVGRRLIAESDRLAEIGHELQHAIGSLDTWAWDGHSRRRAEPMLSRVRPESARVAEGLDELGRKLTRVADVFEQEDNTAARNLEGMPWVDFALGAGKAGFGGGGGSAGAVDLSAERIDDLKKILHDSSSGKRVAAWLDKHGVKIEFGDPSNPRAIASCSPDGKRIIINKNYAHLSDLALAAVLLHEGQHSLDTHPLDIPIVGPIFNAWYDFQEDLMYVAYPFPEEYRAYRAEAEFWLEVRDEAPPESILDDVVNLIFTQDGAYRDKDAVYRDLHNSGYEGWINP